MKLDKVTITGADDKVDVKDLLHLSGIYNYAEWGILFSTSRADESRYPKLEKALSFAGHGLNLSAHLCGRYSMRVLQDEDMSFIDSLHPDYKRVQLNYNFASNVLWGFKHVIKYAETHPERQIIIQWNPKNQFWLSPHLKEGAPENMHFLYDSSGGRGIVIDGIQDPLPNYTGYSGGLYSGNLKKVLLAIEANANPASVYVDMESGVRTNEVFDIEKCRDVLHIAGNHIDGHPFKDEKINLYV